MKKLRLVGRTVTVTPLGLALIVMVAVGVLLVLLASGIAVKIGFVVAVVGVGGIIGGNLPAGLVGGRGGGDAGPRRTLTEAAPPEPEYIESTAPVSEDAWRREQQRYRQRDQNR